MRHFINLDDISFLEYRQIIELAKKIKLEHQAGVINKTLENKTLAMIFDKASTRTRVSFETGMTQLGGHAIFLSNKDTQLGRNESMHDSAKVISSMVDLVMLRISSHSDIEEFAQYSDTPVINALSDQSHPCQLLADLLTYEEHRGDIAGKTVTWVGDGNNVCQTYMQAASLCGFHLNIATPVDYEPDASYCAKYAGSYTLFNDANKACKNSDLIVTDVWASMGEEAQKDEKSQIFAPYQVNQAMMELANSDALFMHCLPTYRGKEVTAEVIDGKQSVVFDAAQNRLHAQKSLVLFLLGEASSV